MSAILIISVFLFFVASYAILRTKRSSSQEDAPELPAGLSPRGLFDAPGEDPKPKLNSELVRRDKLRERGARGDLSALAEAYATGDAALYRFILQALVARASDDAVRVRELAAYVAGGRNLRASPELAGLLLGVWREGPTPASTAELLRVSALSDDAGTYGHAVNEVLNHWEGGGLDGLSGEALRALFDAEYWLLSSEAKRSGAGFVLKQRLADVRRRLTADVRDSGRPGAAGRVSEGERPPPP